MFDYIPEVFKAQYAQSEEEGDRWYEDPDNNRRPPELLPRDEVARAINSEVKAGRGSPHGGVFLDVSTRLAPEVIKKKLPSMWHQFKELADVDITKQAMEVGPTCHYVMGGILVDPDTGAAAGVPGLFAAGESAGGMHGSNRLGGNSLSDLLVFGRRAGAGAVAYFQSLGGNAPQVTDAAITKASDHALAPLRNPGGENPYTIQADLQQVTNDLVGIIRTKLELEESLGKLKGFRARLANITCPGGSAFNSGWHLALDLENMLLVSDCIAHAALIREESRGGHTREDFPKMNAEWRKFNLVAHLANGEVVVEKQALPEMRDELLNLFDVVELGKYMTPEELTRHSKGVNA